MKVVCVGRVKYGGKVHEPGQTLDVPKKIAQELIELGAVKPLKNERSGEAKDSQSEG